MADRYSTNLDELDFADNYNAKEEQELGIDSSPNDVPKINEPVEDNSLARYNSMPTEELTREDVELSAQPDNPITAVKRTYDEPLINPTDNSPEADQSAWETAKDLGLVLLDGAWEGAQNTGMALAEIADAAVDMESPTHFQDYWKENVLNDPEPWDAEVEQIITNSKGMAFAKSTGQFLVGFIPLVRAVRVLQGSGKVLPWVKKVVGTGTAGAVADYAVWDYTDERLLNFMDSFGNELISEAARDLENDPDANLAVIRRELGELMTNEYLQAGAYKEGDTAIQARLKQAAEGFVLGKIIDPLMGALSLFTRSKKSIKATGESNTKNVKTELEELADTINIEVNAPVKVGGRKATVVSVDGDNVTIKYPKSKDGEVKVVNKNQLQPPTTPKYTKAELARLQGKQDLVPPKKSQVDFNKAFAETNIKAAVKSLESSFDPLIDSITSLQDMEKLIAHATELAENAIDVAKTETRTWKQTAANVAKKNATPASALKTAKRKTSGLDADVLAAGLINNSMKKRVFDAASLKAAGKLSTDEYQKIVAYAYATNQYTRQIFGEVGRALNVVKYANKATGELDLNKMFNMIEKQGFSNIDEHARLVKRMGDADSIPDTLLDSVGERSWTKAWGEAFINSVLSPTSLGINITSNTIMMLARTADIHMAAFRGLGGVTHKQAIAHTLGYLRAIPEAFMVMMRSYKQDKNLFSGNVKFTNEFKPKAAITAENIGFRGDDLNPMKQTVNKTIDTVGKVIRGVPGATRSMMATDEFFKILNHRAYSMKIAMEAVEQEGANLFKNPKLYARKVNENFEGIMNSSKAKARDAGWGSKEYYNLKNHEAAMEEAHLATFTNSWGPKGEGAYRALRSAPWTSFILPFVRQPLNNMFYLVQSTPGLNLLSRRMSAEIAAGGARAEIALAHLNVASMVWAYAFTMAMAEGEKLQGNPKSDPGWKAEQRDLGIDPNTFQEDDGDYALYRGGEPIAGRWAIASGVIHHWMRTLYEAGSDMTDEEVMEAAYRMVIGGALTVIDNFKDQSSLRGLEATMKLLEGGTEEQFKDRTMFMVSGWTGVLSGQIKYIREHYLGEDQVRYDPDNFSEAMQMRYGFGDVVELNAFGDPKPGANPQMLGEIFNEDSGALNPLNAIPTNIRLTKNPFKEEWQKEIIKVKQELPGQSVLGEVPKRIKNVKIDNRERHNLLRILKHIKLNGKTLGERMTLEMNKPRYKREPAAYKAEVINQVYRGYMQAASELMIVDAHAYYENKPRPQTQNWGLIDYGRSKSLNEIFYREKAKDFNRKTNDPDKQINLDDINSKVKKGESSAYERARKIFYNN
jgi:hypothetical protein